ncbi:DUF4176 domain-containing protein [Priestia flexa]|uniref:DUF4176 domain-containing protein n=1 Tax=Priestia flexa TaxID=86664 RepID=UPI001EF44016|nr:DUF4176 domain-containing protein [Priestia flexa]MCG7314204.1 DUF4176 domain-containing protein [Priestia flexa]
MMKKTMRFLTFSIAVMVLLVGCSSASSSEPNKVNEPKVKEEESNAATKAEKIQAEDATEEVDTTKLLPIGTVVKLRNVEKSVMIYGRFQKQASTGQTFDYVSVPYPEGNINEDYNLFFNRNMIESVQHVGMKSPEEEQMSQQVEQDIAQQKQATTQ